jgi:predicted 2-oxoglutarate/Fe(II)-dependent dioxygenase YbiX
MENNSSMNILIKKNVLNKEAITFLMDFVKNKEKVDLSVFSPENSNKTGKIESSVEKEIRNTQFVDYEEIMDLIYDLYKNIVKNIINPSYKIEVHDSEMPQFLHYGVGGHYKPHNDSESLWKAPNGDVFWRKSMDRDLSTILFLNDDFEGGNLIFPEFNLTLKPEPGLLVCFPSNHNYLHGVEPVTRGTRYSIVSWMTVKGQKTIEEETREINLKYGIDS